MKTRMQIWRWLLIAIGELFIGQSASGFYDPSAQRWINRDPVQERGGINLFTYNAGNPISAIDPFGLGCWDSITWTIINCAKIPGWSYSECICNILAPGGEDELKNCLKKTGACVELIGSKFKDVGALCDCLCSAVNEDSGTQKKCTEACTVAKNMIKLFNK